MENHFSNYFAIRSDKIKAKVRMIFETMSNYNRLSLNEYLFSTLCLSDILVEFFPPIFVFIATFSNKISKKLLLQIVLDEEIEAFLVLKTLITWLLITLNMGVQLLNSTMLSLKKFQDHFKFILLLH